MKQGTISTDVKDGNLVVIIEPGDGVPSARGAISVLLPDGSQAQLNINLTFTSNQGSSKQHKGAAIILAAPSCKTLDSSPTQWKNQPAILRYSRRF